MISSIDISTLLTTISLKDGLVVLLGFQRQKISNSIPYVFDTDLSVDDFLQENKKEERKELSKKIMSKCSSNLYYCYFEDLFCFPDFIDGLSSFINITYLKNPCLLNIIPTDFNFAPYETLDDNSEDAKSIETLDSVFLNDFTNESLKTLIGQVYKNNKSYFFTLLNELPLISIDVHNEIIIEKSQIGKKIYLNNDESSYINFLSTIENTTEEYSIVFDSNQSEEKYSPYLKNIIYYCNAKISLFDSTYSEPKKIRPECKELLSEIWHYSSFRTVKVYPEIKKEEPIPTKDISQDEIMSSILNEADKAKSNEYYRDIFVTAPTGSGKSILFQIPALALAKQGYLTLVIQPLVALMNDQVTQLHDRGVTNAATINSSISLDEKNEIMDKIHRNEIDIIFLSPESLLSRSDITMLIGERKIGLLVIDEAHIVTTWGKEFRPDYWYLGTYIQKLRKDRNFPIATFTATAIYDGVENMVADIRDSIGMRDPIKYYGYVPRNNIDIEIQKADKSLLDISTREYSTKKNTVLAARIAEFQKLNKKTLVYFPMIKLINEFGEFLSEYENEVDIKRLSRYDGAMKSDDKKENFERFKNGDANVMLATKAFGMGIDIPDIDIVYHFAPTGNVCDYVQEIGRCARDKSIQGLAAFDFFPNDFKYVNLLQGISSIRKNQLVQVLQIIKSIGAKNNYKRNLLITSSDFQSAFDSVKEDELDNKVKTALLLIEKDFIAKYGYSPIVARPRAIFTKGLFKLHRLTTDQLKSLIGNNFSVVNSNTVIIDLKNIWEQKFSNQSFQQFKYELYSNPKKINLIGTQKLIPQMEISTRPEKLPSGRNYTCKSIIEFLIRFCEENKQKSKYFSKQDLSNEIRKTFGLSNIYELQILTDTIIRFLFVFSSTSYSHNSRFIKNRNSASGEDSYLVDTTGYLVLRDFYNSYENKILYESIMYFDMPSSESTDMAMEANRKRMLSMLGLFNTFKLLSFEVNGGLNPEIFIRINSYEKINQIINKQGENYINNILTTVYHLHIRSVEFLTYIFKTIGIGNTKKFWDYIELYFMGVIPQEVEEEIAAKKNPKKQD